MCVYKGQVWVIQLLFFSFVGVADSYIKISSNLVQVATIENTEIDRYVYQSFQFLGGLHVTNLPISLICPMFVLLSVDILVSNSNTLLLINLKNLTG